MEQHPPPHPPHPFFSLVQQLLLIDRFPLIKQLHWQTDNFALVNFSVTERGDNLQELVDTIILTVDTMREEMKK